MTTQLTVEELCDRYNLASRKTLYSRLNGLGITLPKDNGKAFATEEHIALLDGQNEHLKSGGTISNFIPTSKVTLHDTPQQSPTQHNTTQEKTVTVPSPQHSTTQLQMSPELLTVIMAAINPDPLFLSLSKLEIASSYNWQFTTSQIADIIGIKPRTKKGETEYKRGSFVFKKVGKIGNETSWIVQKR